jgi:hypothetical protein
VLTTLYSYKSTWAQFNPNERHITATLGIQVSAPLPIKPEQLRGPQDKQLLGPQYHTIRTQGQDPRTVEYGACHFSFPPMSQKAGQWKRK